MKTGRGARRSSTEFVGHHLRCTRKKVIPVTSPRKGGGPPAGRVSTTRTSRPTGRPRSRHLAPGSPEPCARERPRGHRVRPPRHASSWNPHPRSSRWGSVRRPVHPEGGWPLIEKVLRSAIANAEHNHRCATSTTWWSSDPRTGGPSMNGRVPTRWGRATSQQARTSHLDHRAERRDDGFPPRAPGRQEVSNGPKDDRSGFRLGSTRSGARAGSPPRGYADLLHEDHKNPPLNKSSLNTRESRDRQ